MPATDLITPEVHDPLAIRRAGPEVLGLALMDARTRTLAWLSAFDGHSLPSTHAEFDAPLWLAGHVAWFQEWWIARNVQRSRVRLRPQGAAPAVAGSLNARLA